jgi:ferredoxin
MGSDLYEIKAEACTECVGFHGEPQCAAVCPVDACHVDPAEAEAALIARAKQLHPGKDFSGNVKSHFRK